LRSCHRGSIPCGGILDTPTPYVKDVADGHRGDTPWQPAG
jgi:hypothetical protein